MFLTALLTVVLLHQPEAVTSRYLPTTAVAATTDWLAVNVTGVAASPGIVDVTIEDVERHLQQKEAVVIDVRKFDEAAEFGKIPSSHVLPGSTEKHSCNVLYLSN